MPRVLMRKSRLFPPRCRYGASVTSGYQAVRIQIQSGTNGVDDVFGEVGGQTDKTALLNQMLVVPLKQGFLRVVH
jgi:hypothetical protein